MSNSTPVNKNTIPSTHKVDPLQRTRGASRLAENSTTVRQLDFEELDNTALFNQNLQNILDELGTSPQTHPTLVSELPSISPESVRRLSLEKTPWSHTYRRFQAESQASSQQSLQEVKTPDTVVPRLSDLIDGSYVDDKLTDFLAPQDKNKSLRHKLLQSLIPKRYKKKTAEPTHPHNTLPPVSSSETVDHQSAAPEKTKNSLGQRILQYKSILSRGNSNGKIFRDPASQPSAELQPQNNIEQRRPASVQAIIHQADDQDSFSSNSSVRSASATKNREIQVDNRRFNLAAADYMHYNLSEQDLDHISNLGVESSEDAVLENGELKHHWLDVGAPDVLEQQHRYGR